MKEKGMKDRGGNLPMRCIARFDDDRRVAPNSERFNCRFWYTLEIDKSKL
jgi:hypothetical protein